MTLKSSNNGKPRDFSVRDLTITWDGKAGVAEASTLGFKPGDWPTQIQIGEQTFSRAHQMTGRNGQFTGYTYMSDRVPDDTVLKFLAELGAADVLPLEIPVAGLPAAHDAQRSHAAVLLVPPPLDRDHLAGRFISACKHAAHHDSIRTGSDRLCHVTGEPDAAVRDNRDACVPRHVRDLEVANIQMKFEKEDLRPAIVCVDADGVEIDGAKAQLAEGVSPAKFEGVKRLVVRNSPGLEGAKE
jgi:hypothetical protein